MDLKKFSKSSDRCIILSPIKDNETHSHYAVQIVFSLEKAATVTSGDQQYSGDLLAIKPLVPHRLDSHGHKVLIFLINPASLAGHALSRHLFKDDIGPFEPPWARRMKDLGVLWNRNRVSDVEFLQKVHLFSADHFAECLKQSHKTDSRIVEAINILEQHAEEILSLEEISRKVALSPSRFIHLFKKETGITYRRMQIWLRILNSFDNIERYPNLTDLAIASGFSDSAHYSRTFKETFGAKPSLFLKNSQFIQV